MSLIVFVISNDLFCFFNSSSNSSLNCFGISPIQNHLAFQSSLSVSHFPIFFMPLFSRQSNVSFLIFSVWRHFIMCIMFSVSSHPKGHFGLLKNRFFLFIQALDFPFLVISSILLNPCSLVFSLSCLHLNAKCTSLQILFINIVKSICLFIFLLQMWHHNNCSSYNHTCSHFSGLTLGSHCCLCAWCLFSRHFCGTDSVELCNKIFHKLCADR